MPTPNRQRLIRLIHVAKRDLSMDDDTYRAILQRIGKKASSADLTIPELEKVLEHLKRSGFKVRSKAKPAQAKPSRPLAQDGESKKIRALWLFLHELGAVKNPSEEALATYVKRIAGVDALQWISGEQAERLQRGHPGEVLPGQRGADDDKENDRQQPVAVGQLGIAQGLPPVEGGKQHAHQEQGQEHWNGKHAGNPDGQQGHRHEHKNLGQRTFG